MEIKTPELDKIISLLEDIKGLLQHVTTTPAMCVADPETLTPAESAVSAKTAVPTAPAKPQEMPPPPTAAPVSVAPLTLAELVKACRPLVDGGKREAIKEIITGLGYEQLSEVPSDKYEALAEKLRELGAVI